MRQVHPIVAPNLRCGSRPREQDKEMGESFSSSVPLNTYLPNPSKLCTWNVSPPSPPATAKSWRRTATTQSSLRAGLA